MRDKIIQLPPWVKVIHDGNDRENWLLARQDFVGASDVAALMGDSPWLSPVGLWRRKVCRETLKDSPAMEWGRRLEFAVAQAAAEKIGADDVVLDGRLLEHGPCRVSGRDGVAVESPGIYGLAVTPDAWLVWSSGRHELLEVKTTSERNGSAWGDEESPVVPRHYWWQLQAQMAVIGCSHAYIACLVGGQHLVGPIEVQADAEAQQRMANDVERFVRDMRSRDRGEVEPIPSWLVERTDAESYRKEALERRPRSDGESVLLPADADELISLRENLRSEERSLAERRKSVENALIEMLGENSRGVTVGGATVSYNLVEKPERVVKIKAQRYRTLRISKKGKAK